MLTCPVQLSQPKGPEFYFEVPIHQTSSVKHRKAFESKAMTYFDPGLTRVRSMTQPCSYSPFLPCQFNLTQNVFRVQSISVSFNPEVAGINKTGIFKKIIIIHLTRCSKVRLKGAVCATTVIRVVSFRLVFISVLLKSIKCLMILFAFSCSCSFYIMFYCLSWSPWAERSQA